MLGGKSQMHVALQFLKLLMFVVLSHFYWVLASRALRCEAAVKRWVMGVGVWVCTVSC